MDCYVTTYPTQLVKCYQSHHNFTYCLPLFCASACFSSRLQTDQENTMLISGRRQGTHEPRNRGGQTSKYHNNTIDLVYNTTLYRIRITPISKNIYYRECLKLDLVHVLALSCSFFFFLIASIDQCGHGPYGGEHDGPY